MIVWAHILGSFAVRVLPIRVAYALAGRGAPIALLFARGHFARARRNMRQILGPQAPEAEVRRLTVAAFANYARYMVDLLRLPLIDVKALTDTFAIRGWEHVERARESGRGVVMVTGHIGSFDLAGAALRGRGLPVHVLVDTLRPPAWDARVQRLREAAGVPVIPVEKGVRDMLAVLRRQEALGILVDRPVQDQGVPVTFFGRETRVPGGAATLAIRTGAPVVPAVLVRDATGRSFVAEVGEPILTEKGAASEADVQSVMQRIMDFLEAMIRRYPDQWFMFRQMWPQT